MKNQKGITLVVLIITIILMLILTTVTVTTSINGGLINSTQSAKENARALEVERAEEMWEISVRDDREDGKAEKTLGELLEELREKELLTEKEVEEIRKNKFITIGNRTISFEINYTSAQEENILNP